MFCVLFCFFIAFLVASSTLFTPFRLFASHVGSLEETACTKATESPTIT